MGFALIASASVAETDGHALNQNDLDTLEQHVGLLTLKDSRTGKLIFCVPSGDTVSEVNSELAAHGVPPAVWQPGVSLVTLVGRPDMQREIDRRAEQVLAENELPVLYHDLQDRRTTFVVSGDQARLVLETLYNAMRSYL